MNELCVTDEIQLDASRFPKKEKIYKVALVISAEAEKRRGEYRSTEKPGVYPQNEHGIITKKGPLTQMYFSEKYWSDFVPWYEWISEPRALRVCAEECQLEIWQMAEMIADEISPKNWQVFSWMAIAYQSNRHGTDLLELANEYAVQHAEMLERQIRSARDAGLASGKIRRDSANFTPQELLEQYQLLMATGTEKHNVATKLASRFKVTPGHIRQSYKKAKAEKRD